MDGATARLTGERQVKRARVDLLTSCAKVLRAIGDHLPDVVFGVGQGGVIAGMIRLPRVVEVTLQARNLQRSEIQKVVSGWSKVKAVWSLSPRIWKTQSGVELLKAACPEVLRPFPIDPIKGYGISRHESKEADMVLALGLGALKAVADVPLCSLVQEPGREVWEHDGRCSCGKRAYLFGRCVSCIEKEAADDLLSKAAEREEEQDKSGEGELLVEELLTFVAAPKGQGGPDSCFISSDLVLRWAKSWVAELLPQRVP